MRRTNWKTVSTLVTMGLLAGCVEQSMLAPESSSTGPAPMMLAPQDRPQLGLNGGNSKNASSDFTVGPWGGVLFAGNHAVVIPAHGICDPATSSYGPGTWDAPCTPLTTTLKIHAEVRTDKDGRVWVDFAPNIRFVPSENAGSQAWIYMYTPGARGARNLSSFNILYAHSIGGPTTDESATDASLRTYVDTRSGISARRIKHFSGYTVSNGRSCSAVNSAGVCTDSSAAGGG